VALWANTSLTALDNLMAGYKGDGISPGFHPLLLPGEALPEPPGPYNPFSG